MPDYSKQYSGNTPKGQPRHQEHNQFGGKAKPFGAKETKAELLARMKAAAEKNKQAD
ncbi:hypothetical protein BVG79_00437 [Ketogulonicigenium robustum]|uniref:Cobalt chelatase n=1 Tax=Ketogulonicigenium robustum TaxID=92947 RepID=A0A1W6NX70_9RHOB|nr:hypothetical protein [Ketogulonicigenium robustum]ARO13791.1 hypothetical protein BVG79_00437 [Ketogulonicigenium robustum]